MVKKEVKVVKKKSKEAKPEVQNAPKVFSKEQLWHSTSHIMADAVKRIWPDVKLAIGPAIEDGFYYDFDKKTAFTEDDLRKTENEMQKIIDSNLKFIRSETDKKQAGKLLKGEPYKLELLNELEDKKISFYQHGNFMDMCAGPHIDYTKRIKAFKLLQTSTAYWRGDSKRPVLQRIYGISFTSKPEMEAFLKMREEAEKRDHAKLGRELDLFITHPAVGKGLPLFTPKGATVKRILQRWIEDEEIKRGYQYTSTPVISKTDIYKLSGHLDHYKDKMFTFLGHEKDNLALRPMTCPFQFLIYNSKQRSYRDLPIKYAETSPLFRYEKSGELHGLIRAWQFTLADAHIICAPSQLESEFEEVLKLIEYIMTTLGLTEYFYKFSKWDPNNKGKYIDNPKAWESSQKILKKILDKNKLKYEEVEGDAAFYGPKLDIQMKNVYGKEDTIFTVQIDFALPERFDMSYIDEKNNKVRPMVIHRSSIGCYERTMAMLIEKYAGAFPVWLAPVQVKVLNMSDDNMKYTEKIVEMLKEKGIRVETDYKAETIQNKVRIAQLEKVPYMLVIGKKEEEAKTIAVRTRDGKVKYGVKSEDFLKQILEEIEKKTN
ncbi:MAG: threonine--tRNA ligase [Nanoarchaeota archaeon]|nr:threonine--tRNA ligase [Nanoarchaeota archaeon]